MRCILERIQLGANRRGLPTRVSRLMNLKVCLKMAELWVARSCEQEADDSKSQGCC